MSTKLLISALASVFIVTLSGAPVFAKGRDESRGDRGLHLGQLKKGGDRGDRDEDFDEKPLDAACAKAAVTTRDNVFVTALEAYLASHKAAILARKDAVVKAFDATDPKARKDQIKAAEKAYKASHKSAEKKWKSSREDSQEKFEDDMEECWVNAPASSSSSNTSASSSASASGNTSAGASASGGTSTGTSGTGQ